MFVEGTLLCGRRFDPVEGRIMHTHISGIQLQKKPVQDYRSMHLLLHRMGLNIDFLIQQLKMKLLLRCGGHSD
jgi:hypothetical protein